MKKTLLITALVAYSFLSWCEFFGSAFGETCPHYHATSGSVAEWSKALDLGSSLSGGVGSNPTTAIWWCLSSVHVMVLHNSNMFWAFSKSQFMKKSICCNLYYQKNIGSWSWWQVLHASFDSNSGPARMLSQSFLTTTFKNVSTIFC